MSYDCCWKLEGPINVTKKREGGRESVRKLGEAGSLENSGLLDLNRIKYLSVSLTISSKYM